MAVSAGSGGAWTAKDAEIPAEEIPAKIESACGTPKFYTKQRRSVLQSKASAQSRPRSRRASN